MTVIKKISYIPLIILSIGLYSVSWALQNKAQNISPTQQLVKFLEKETLFSYKDKSQEKHSEIILNYIEQNPQNIRKILQSSEIDPRVFLAFCIDVAVKKHSIPYLEEADLFEYILEEFKDPKLEWDSKIYSLNQDDILFVWQNSRGNHNNGYWVWRISLKNNNFEPQLCRFKVDNVQKMNYNIDAQRITYDAESGRLIVISRAGTQENYTTTSEFKLENDFLVLDKVTKSKT